MAELLTPFAGSRSHHIARLLIENFGSLNNALGASRERLQSVFQGEHLDVLSLLHGARDLIEASLRECIAGSPVDSSDPRLHRFLRLCFQGYPYESLHVVFVGANKQYLRDERVGLGSIGSVKIHPRTLFRRAFDIGARAFILAHNHPSGNVLPSQEDISTNRRLEQIGNALDLRLTDHLIITQDQVFSLCARRLMA